MKKNLEIKQKWLESSFMRLIESLKKKKFILLNIFLTLYIGINLIGGERGLISYFDKKKLFEELEIKEKMLTNKLQDLEIKYH